MPLPRFVRKIIIRKVMLDSMHYDRLLMQAAKLAGEEYAATGGGE
jgi:hypothetical protein